MKDSPIKPVLEAVNLTKIYEDGKMAVNDLSFRIFSGQIFAMLGANGAGKTTTINIFLNFIDPTSGSALVCGIDTYQEPLLAKKNLAYVSENVILYPNFTGIQNLEFFSRLANVDDVSEEKLIQALRRVGLQDDAHNKKVRDYSKGMRQKCGIAITIMKNAEAILLDEPTAGLDPHAGRDFITLLGSLKSEGKTVFMSTHDIFRAKSIADTVGIMHEGKLVMQRSAEELYNEDLEKLYIDYLGGKDFRMT